MYEENRKDFPFWTYIAKGIGMGVFALAIKLISSFACIAVYAQDGIVGELPDFAADIAIFGVDQLELLAFCNPCIKGLPQNPQDFVQYEPILKKL